jgi:DNA-binding response OmpR family regulator
MRALLIEDDVCFADALQSVLRHRGIICHATSQGEDGISLLRVGRYDVSLIDMGLPDISTPQLVTRLRRSDPTLPIIAFSSSGSVEDRVQALAAGADDYLVKPFRIDELVARIKAVVRRVEGHSSAEISLGDFTVDCHAEEVRDECGPISMSRSEYRVLEVLARSTNQIVEKQRLFENLYDDVQERDAKIIDVFVCKIRAKLRRRIGRDPIVTARGRGYALMELKSHRLPEAEQPERSAEAD